jgi:hypothetical protein
MSANKLVEKRGLPQGKSILDDSERAAMAEHCRKLVRDGAASQIYGVLNIAAAMFNINQFELWKELDADSFVSLAQDQFGFNKTQAYRYVEIGSKLSDALGGGTVLQRQIESLMERQIFQTRQGLSFRQIHTLSKATDGMHRLLQAKSDDDLSGIISDLKKGANEIRAEIDSKPKTELKAAMSKRYSATNPPDQTDITVLFTALIRQLEEINTKYLRKLYDAVRAIPPEYLRNSKKWPAKAQQTWNQIRVMEELLAGVAEVWPDQVAMAHRMLESIGEALPPVTPVQKLRKPRGFVDVQILDDDGEDPPQVSAQEVDDFMKSIDPSRNII